MWILDLTLIIKWYRERTREQRLSIDRRLLLLRKLGPEIGLPNVRNLKDGVFELREMSYGYRLYFYINLPQNKLIVFLMAGDKDQQDNDIKKAKLLLNEIKKEDKK